MSTFREANQVRLFLKMKLSNYSWYSSCGVFAVSDGYSTLITVKKLDNQIRKIIPPIVNGVDVKTEIE